MLVKLKGALTQHPLAGFFGLVGAAYLVFVGVVLAQQSSFEALPLLNRYSTVRVAVTGLVALLCCWVSSGPPTRPPRRFTQLFIVAVVVLIRMAALSCRPGSLGVWSGPHWLHAGQPSGAGLMATSAVAR